MADTNNDENKFYEDEEPVLHGDENGDHEIPEGEIGNESHYEVSNGTMSDSRESVDAGQVGNPIRMTDSHFRSVGDVVPGVGTVVGTGMRREDVHTWENADNERLRRRAAVRAGRQAAADEREALLASGKYFDDGRGNIKLKKEFREYQRVGNGGRRTYNETISDTGTAARAMNRAVKTAYDASMNGWQDALDEQNAEKASASRKKVDDIISLNRQSMKNIDTMKAERAKGQARAKFNMVEGYMAAMDALKTELANTDESSYSPIKAWGQGKPDADGRDRSKWKYDENNRIIGQAEAQPTGKYVKRGFVTGPTLQALNQRIKEHGGNYKIVGLMATQKFNDVKGTAYGKPVVYARVETFDEASGKPVYHDEVFDQERAYALGMEAGKEGEIDDYKNLVWDGIGDIHGERKRAIEAATAKDRAKLAIEQERQKGLAARNDANIAAKERMNEADNKTRLDIAAIRERTLERKKTSDPKFDEKHYNALAARLDSLTKDSDGNDRDPATMTDADRKKAEAIQTAMDDILFGKVNTGGAGGRRGAESAAGGADAAQGVATPEVQADRVAKAKEQLAKMRGGGQNGVQPQAAQGQQAQQGQGGLRQAKIDPNNIKGTGISFTDSDRLKVPAGREKEFEAYMDGIAALYNPFDHEEGKKIVGKDPSRPSSGLVPKDWREKIGKGDFDRDYDFVAAFLAGAKPSVNQEDGAWHMGDVGKLPTHPSFSNESYYARNPKYAPLAGRWEGETYIPGEVERRANDGKPPATGNAPQQNAQNVGKQSGAEIVEQFGKKGETANATSQANNEKQSGSGKEQDIDLSDVQEGIDRSAAGADDVYRTIPREIIKRVKDATGASDEEIMSGKYDRQIEALGARVGNDSVKGISDRRKAAERNLEAIKGKRKAEAKQEGFRKRQMAFASARKEMEKKARDEAEKYGVAHGYNDSQIEKRAGTSIRRGLIELRDKYGLAADGSQDYMVSKK